MSLQAAQAEVAMQMRKAAQSSPQDNRQLERQQVSCPTFHPIICRCMSVYVCAICLFSMFVCINMVDNPGAVRAHAVQ